MRLTPNARAWLTRALDNCEVVQTARIASATSSSVYVVQDGIAPRAVLRIFSNARWLAEEPDIAAHEAAVLGIVESAGLAAPRLLAATFDAEPFGAPAVLMTFVPGSVELRPRSMTGWIDRMAAALAEVHAVRVPGFAWQHRSWVDRTALAPPEWSAKSALWERAIETGTRDAPVADEVLIHRDFHPCNVLWRDERVSGIVDWPNGCRGPAGVDVAHCRTNLAVMYGADVAEQFLRAYERHVPAFRYQAHWELDSLLDALQHLTYYPPWSLYGLAPIAPGLLRSRLDDHLERIAANL